MLSSLFNDIIGCSEFLPLFNNSPKNDDECSSCLLNKENLPAPEYILYICLQLLKKLHEVNFPPTLSKSVLNAYSHINVYIIYQ